MADVVFMAACLSLALGIALSLWAWFSVRRSTALRQARSDELALEAAGLRREVARLQSEAQFLKQFLREFPHLARDLHSGVHERRIPAVLLNMVMRILEPRQALVLLRRRRAETDPTRESRLVVAAVGPASASVKQGTEFRIGEGEIGLVASVQLAMDRHDLDNQTAATRSRLRQERLAGFELDLAAPMVFGNETVGVIAVDAPAKTSPDAKDVLRVIAQIGALAVHDVVAYAEMKTTADIDGLTKIFNKRHLTQFLADEILSAQDRLATLAVFLFDIDNFKHYNDTHGHVAGDVLLREMARLVEDNTRKGNVFGRFGGEEFLLILPGATSEQGLLAAEKIRSLIAAHPFSFAGAQPLGCISVSGGVAQYPKDGLDSSALLRAADEALYQAKHQGRNRVLASEPRYLGEEPPLDGAV